MLDDSSMQGKYKKFELSRVRRKYLKIRKWNGKGMQAAYRSLKKSKKFIDISRKKKTKKQQQQQNTRIQGIEYKVALKQFQRFRLQYLSFFIFVLTCCTLKTWWSDGGRQKLLRVTEGNCSTFLRRKSRENRFWFDLARVWVIGSTIIPVQLN